MWFRHMGRLLSHWDQTPGHTWGVVSLAWFGKHRCFPGKSGGGGDPEVCDLGCEQWYRWMNKYVSVRIKQRYILMDHSLQQKCHDKSAQPAVRMIGEPLPILSVWRLIPKSYLMFPYRCISNKFTSYKVFKKHQNHVSISCSCLSGCFWQFPL